jgi:hypothetical protein
MLKKITRKARHHFASQKKTYTAASLGLFSATFLLLVIFFTTRPIKPFIAELALVEYSILGKTAGSVIPASGESLPETYPESYPETYAESYPETYAESYPETYAESYPETYAESYPETYAQTYAQSYESYESYETYDPTPYVGSAVLQGSNVNDVTVTITCTNSTNYQVRRSNNTIVYSGTYSGSPVTTGGLGGEDVYTVYCRYNSTNSSPTSLIVDSDIFATQLGTLTASPRSIKRGGSTALTWDLEVATSTCRLRAIALYPALCDATTCKAPRDAAVTTLNNTLTNGSTDVNDPYWLRNGTTRTMIAALTQSAYSTTHAKGKKTVPVEYSTTFNLRCGNLSQSQQVNVLVTDELEQ